MKYFITFIVLAIAIFVTINEGKKNTARLPSFSPPEWEYWGGKKPLNAEYIARSATKLYYKCGYRNFKFVGVDSTEKRRILDTWRYRVQFRAKKCERKKRCEHKCVEFQAIFKNEVKYGKLRLNVTRLGTERSCELVIQYKYH